MLKSLKRAFQIPALRKRIIFTLLMLVVYRVGANILVPGMDNSMIKNQFEQSDFLSMYDMLSGGALSQFTLFALGVTPYITASIIMQLLAVAIPSLEEMQKEGEEGRKKISAYTRYMSVGLAIFQSFALSYGFFNSAIITKDTLSIISIVLTLTAGTTFLMWLGEIITEKGLGNGMSFLIYAGIVSRNIAPTKVKRFKERLINSSVGLPGLIPGINPLPLFKLSATSSGLNVISI